MKIVIIGAGPAGLYCGLLLKKANLARDVTIIERNPPDATYGWGVVFSEETLTGRRRRTSRAFLTFVAIDENGDRLKIPPLLVETEEERRVCEEAHARRKQRLLRRIMAEG